MASRYGYAGLDSALQEIRLLHLLPGSGTEPLRCELEVASLAERPHYEGLSYVWGKQGHFETVQLGGEPFEITTNLWVALYCLRRRQHERILWVDAACINQNDLEERSYQVTLMGEIYSAASHIFVWLGDSISGNNVLATNTCNLEDGKGMVWIRENINRVFSSAFSDSECETLAALGVLHLLSIDKHWTAKSLFIDRDGQYQIAEKYVTAWKSLLKLFQLPWWSRIWVVQEAALAKKASLVIGSVSVPWDLITAFCISYVKHLPPGACCHSSATWRMTPALWDDIVLMRLTVWSFYTSRNEIALPPSKPVHTVFWDHLWQLRHKEATDPRDKVYGLLGLLHKHATFMLPDYSLTTSEVFARCTQALIQSDNNLNALMGPRLRQDDLPTWVIDFLPKGNSVSVLYFQNIFKRISSATMFNACQNQQLWCSMSGDLLSVRGVQIDTVERTAPAWVEGRVAETVKDWGKLANTTTHPRGCTYSDAFWRTIIRDTIRDYHAGETTRRADSTDESAYMQFREWLARDLKSTDVMTAEFTNFRKSFFIATQYQNFFTTRKGYIGLGDQPQANDKIWTLSGGCVPFILRPYPNDSQHTGRYALVGDCYVHGIMDGEAMKDWEEDDVRVIHLV